MVGDAISHAVLPGIVVSFLLSGSREGLPVFLGAVGTGLFSSFFIEWLHKKAGLQNEASIGVTFTWMFALGILLISVLTGQVDLDQDCVLYGEIAFVPLDLWIGPSGFNLGPRAFWYLVPVLLINIFVIYRGYKEFQVSAFDPQFAAVTGISLGLWHYLLMGMVSVTTVASFNSVGAILVVALLTVPPATAWLLTDSFYKMLWVASLVAVTDAVGGFLLARALDGSIAGAIATFSGIVLLLAFLFRGKVKF